MITLPHHLGFRLDADGHRTVEVVFDLTAAQAGAAAHAVKIIRDERYRSIELSVDDILAMREMTSLADELAHLHAVDASDRIHASVARIGMLRSALEEFAAGEHLERIGDADARPTVFSLVDAVADLHAEALHAALNADHA
jgi:CHAD domain-containing protein